MEPIARCGRAGTNGCYVERVARIPKLSTAHRHDPDQSMIVNCEWGNFASSHLPMTADDLAADAQTANPGECYFEKLTSGLYMGECVCPLSSSLLKWPCICPCAQKSDSAIQGACSPLRLPKIRPVRLAAQVRCIILNLAENADMFGGFVPEGLREPYSLMTPATARMDEDTSLALSGVAAVMRDTYGLDAARCPFRTRMQARCSSFPGMFVTL